MKFLTAILLFSTALWAQEKSSNFMEVDLKLFEYNKLKNGQKGRVEAREARLSRADLTFNFQNKDKIFDSRVYSDNDSITFKSDFMNFDFRLKEKSDFFAIQDLNIYETLAIINPRFFSAEGEMFHLGYDDLSLKVNNYLTYCTMNDPDFDMATAVGIENGCMNQLSLYPSENHQHIPFAMTLLYDDGDKMDLKAKIQALNLTNAKNLEILATESLINLMGFVVKTQDLSINCLKDSNDFTFNPDKVLKDCENTAEVNTDRIVIINDEDKTRFFIKPRHLKIESGNVSFDSEAVQFVDEEKNVTIYDLKLDCVKSDVATVYDLHSLIGECVRSGKVNIGKIFDKKDRLLFDSYDKVLTGELDPLEKFDKTRVMRGRGNYRRKFTTKDQELQASDLKISISDGQVAIELVAYKKVLGATIKRDVTINGEFVHRPEDGILEFKVTEAEVPIILGFKYGKDFISDALAELIVGETVTWNNENTFYFHL